MRGRLLNLPAIGRAVGFALVAAAIVAAALHFRTSELTLQGLQVSPARRFFTYPPAATVPTAPPRSSDR
jgi:hypothetical protein